MSDLSSRLAAAFAASEPTEPGSLSSPDVAATMKRAEQLAAEVARGSARRDWPRVLTEMRTMLERLMSFDLVREDARCRKILEWMTVAEGMDEFDRLVDLLQLRVNELLAARGVLSPGDSRSRRRGMTMDAKADHETLAEWTGRESRVLLRL